jgi:large repetitive protein
MRKSVARIGFLMLSLMLVFQLLLPAGSVLAAAPGTPNNLTAKLTSPSDVLLQWDAVSGVTGYKVYEVTNGAKNLLYSPGGNVRSLNALSQGVHSYAVSAYTSGGESELSVPVTVTVTYPTMQPPATVNATVMNVSNISLSWTASTYAQSYNVFEVIDGTKKLVSNGVSNSAYLSNVQQGTHTYVVSAVNTMYGESAVSEPKGVTIAYPTMQPPANFKYSVVNGNDISLQWEAASNAVSYNLYEVVNGARSLIVNVGTLSRMLTAVTEGKHVYQITSVSDRFGESQTSSELTVDVTFPTMQSPAGFTYSFLNGNDLRLGWSDASYAQSYNLYQTISGERKLLLNIAGTAKIFPNLPEGIYHYDVTSVSSRFGESKTATPLDVQIVYPAMEPPANAKYTLSNGNDIALNWSTAAYATNYKVYQVVNGVRQLITTSAGLGAQIKNLPAGPFLYEITSYSDRFGESKTASVVSGTLAYPVLKPPVTVKATVTNGNDLTLNWDVAQYADYYKVYIMQNGALVFKTNASGTSISFPRIIPKGDYTYEVRSYSDRFGESPTGTQVIAHIDFPDLLAPQIKIALTSPTSAQLTWYGTLYAESYNVYRMVAGAPQLVGNTKTTQFDLTGLDPTQTYTYVVATAHSRYGESPYSNEATVQFDTRAPQTGSNLIEGKWYNADKTVQLTATDDLTGVSKTSYNLDGAGYADGVSVLVKGDGIHQITYYSVDKAGNTEAERTEEVKIDTVAPVTTTDYVEGGPLPKVINLTATDDRSGVSNTYYIINGGGAVKGMSVPLDASVHTVTFYSMDLASNVEAKKTITINSDITAPVTTSNIKDQWLTGSYDVQLTATDDVSGVDKTYYSVNGSAFTEGTSFTVSKEGLNEIKFYSVDKAGNRESDKSATVKIDLTAPETTTNASDDWKTSAVNLTFTAIDRLSGIAKTYYSVDSGDYAEGEAVKIAEEGVHSVSFYSIDQVGNKEEVKTVSVKVDKTAPLTTYTKTAGLTGKAMSLNLAANDNLSGVAKTVYRINDGEEIVGTSIPLNDAGNYTIRFHSVDVAGNVEEDTVIGVMIDTEAPVTVTSLEDKWYNYDVDVELKATDDASGVDKTFYALDDAADAVGNAFTVSKEGEHTLTFHSVDKVGNLEAPKTATLKIDKTKPVTTATPSKNTAQPGYTVTLTATDDRSGVAKTVFSLNGKEQDGNVISFQEPGIYNIKYYSVDKAGNVEDVHSLDITIDNTAPVTTSNLKDQWYNTDIGVSLSATDDLSGVDKTYYSIDGGDMTEGNGVKITSEGEHEVSFYSVDLAGNIEQVKTEKAKLDKTAPVTTSNLTEGYAPIGQVVQLSATDNLSGVAVTYYSINDGPLQEGSSFKIENAGVTTVKFFSWDKAGNVEKATIINFLVDKTAPDTLSDIVDVWNNADITVNLTATDDVSGVDKTYYSVDGADFTEGTSFVVAGEGQHEVSYYSVDKAGNKEEPKHKIVKIDATAPVSVFDARDGWYNAEASFVLTATDNLSGLEVSYVSLDGADFKEATSVNITTSGVHKISFYSVDKAGNKEDIKSVEVNVDLKAPVTTSDADDAWHAGAVTVNLTATDDLSGVDKTYYTVDGGDQQEGTSFAVSGSGKHVITFWSVDKAGNVEKANTAFVKIDSIAPVTTADAKEGWNHNDFTVSLSATDDASGVKATYYSVDGSEMVEGDSVKISTDGTHKITFYSVDNAGNKEETQSIDVKLDKTAPVTKSNLTTGHVKLGLEVQLTATDNLSGVAKTYYTINDGAAVEGSTFKIDQAGVYKVTYYSVDNAGNIETANVFEFTVDSNPPVTVSDIEDQWNTAAVPVHLTATDDMSGVDKTFYSVDGAPMVEGTSFTVSGNGIHNVKFYSVDKAGNIEQTHSVEVKIDDQAPVTVTDAKDGWYPAAASVKLTATDDLSGVKSTYYSVDGAAYAEGSSVNVGSGTHTITFYTVDKAGNKEEVKSVQIKVDAKPPVTASNVSGNAVTLAATDDLSGVDKTYYTIDGGAKQEGTSFVVNGAGTHTVTYYSVDKAGNAEAVKTLTIKSDSQPPVTKSNITSKWYKGDATVTLKASDDLSGVKTTYYTVDGGAQQTGTTFSVTGEGTHKVTFYSVDNAGNVEAVHTEVVMVDNTPPVVTLTTPVEAAMGSMIKLTYTATDKLSGVASQQMTVNGKPVANGSTVTLSQPGEYTVTVTVTDNAGWTTTVTKKITVYVAATMDVTPKVITCNDGVFTVRLTLPKGTSYNFDLSTVKVNGASPIDDKGNAQAWMKNGMFKFNRTDVKWTYPQTTLEFRGYVNGVLIVATKSVAVNSKDCTCDNGNDHHDDNDHNDGNRGDDHHNDDCDQQGSHHGDDDDSQYGGHQDNDNRDDNNHGGDNDHGSKGNDKDHK